MANIREAGTVFSGVGVALITLFADDGSLDAAGSAAHAVRLVDLGVQAVVVAGSTGEAAALDAEERVALLASVKAAVGGRVPVIAGTGAASARKAVSLSRDAADAGADALLVLSPPGAADTKPYYEAVAQAVAVPVLGYHFPAVSPPGISVPDLASLPIAGVKDSSGDPDRLLDTLDAFDRPVYTGSSAILSFAGPLGCTGAILSVANVEPERCVAAFAGDAAAQRGIADAHRAARGRFPRGIKEVTAQRFGTSPLARMG